MSIFGKVLAILNVLAAIGAVALLAMDYAKRHAWEYAVFREELMINGLPLDEKQVDDQGRLLFEKIGPQTQRELGITPPVTQEAEVQRVRDRLKGKIDSAGDKKKQIYLSARVLMPFAITNEQRQGMIAYQTYLRDDKAFDRLKQMFAGADQAARLPPPKGERKKEYDEAFRDALAARYTDPAGPLAEAFLAVKKANRGMPFDQALDQSLGNQLAQLQDQFKQVFDEALKDDQTQAAPQRKRNIAHVLFNTVDALPDEVAGGAAPKLDLMENPNYKRFVTVVGVRAAVNAVNEEAHLLQEIAAEVGVERLRERSTFALEHRKVVAMIQNKASEVEKHGQLLASKRKELDAHEEDLKKRRLDVQYYQEQLDAARKETAQHLKELRTMSAALFQERVKLRDATAENQKLEKDIRALEQER